MLSESKRLGIRNFVKETLGCACPDELFADIGCHLNSAVGPEAPYTQRLLVGQRLLVYLLNLPDAGALESLLPAMIEQGRRERDGKGLNRFRAVIVTAAKAQVQPRAEALFAEIDGKDDRVHLHVLAPGDILDKDWLLSS